MAARIVLCIGVVLSAAAWLFTQSVVEHDARAKFQSVTSAVAASTQQRIRSYVDLLYGLQGLFQAEPAVSRAAFERYIGTLNLPLHYPGVNSIAYAERVPAAAKAEFERRLHRDPELVRRHYTNVRIMPSGERPEYLIMTYVEPFHAHKGIIGYDVAADANLMSAIARARDTSMPTATQQIALRGHTNEPAIVMRLALYRQNAFTADVPQRREAFVGLVNVTFQVPELAQHALSGEGYKALTVSIRDTGYADAAPHSSPASLLTELYSSDASVAPAIAAKFEDTRHIDVGQRRWELHFSAPQSAFFGAADRVLPWAVSSAALIVSLLLSGLIRSQATSEQRAKTLAEQMTADLVESQAKLTEEKRRTQELIEVLPNPIYFKGTDGRYLGVNRAWENFFGTPRGAFLGKTVRDLYPYHPEIADRLLADDRALWERPGTQVYETTITTPDGKSHNAIYYKATFAHPDGSVAGLIGTIVDITEHKQAAEASARLAAIVDNSSDAIIGRAMDGKIVSWNAAAEQLFGYTTAEAIGDSLMQMVPPERHDEVATGRELIRQGIAVPSYETTRLTKDGRQIDISVSVSPIRNASGTLIGMAAIAHDITRQKELEREARRKAAVSRLLETLARAANEAATPEEAMQTCLAHICEYGGWMLGRLGIYAAGEDGRFPGHSLWHPSDSTRFAAFIAASHGTRKNSPSGRFVSVVIRDKKPVWLEDLTQIDGFGRAAAAAACGLRSAFAFPIIVRDEVVAFLEFFGAERRVHDPLLIEASTNVGAQLARLTERKQAEDALRASAEALRLANQQLQMLIQSSPLAIFTRDTNGRVTNWNPAAEITFGWKASEVLGKPLPTIPDEMLTESDGLRRRLLAGNEPFVKAELRRRRKDGSPIDISTFMGLLRDPSGKVNGVISVVADITEQKRTERQRAMEYAVTRLLSGAETPEDVLSNIIQSIGEALGCVCGAYWSPDEHDEVMVCGGTWSVSSPDIMEFSAFSRGFRHPLRQSGGLFMRVWRSGEPTWIADVTQDTGFLRAALAAKARLRGALAFPVRSSNETLGIMEFFSRAGLPIDEVMLQSTRSIGSQIGQFIARRKAEELVRHLAHYDELTGLFNRSMFTHHLTHVLAQARRNDKGLALMFIDVDRFKNINDTLGHEAGDLVLKEVAVRLRGCLRDSDTIGRLGGDEFVVLLEEIREPAQCATVAQKILAAVNKPFVINTQRFHLSASIGISTYPGDCQDVQCLLKNADVAMYRAKELGRNNYQFYSAQMNVHTLERLALESDLRHAVERNEFVLHYQPILDMRSGRITAVEALVRWQHPTQGLIPPARFIPLAEETGLIEPIGEWVLQNACAQNKSWQERGLPPLRIAVNLSARQFAQENLVQNVERVLKETGLDPKLLEFEITESMVMQDPDGRAKLLGRLKAMGIHISIDDFGTGYSSLSYLKRFPIDSVKIDRSFIKDLPQDGDDAALTLTVIAMARSLKLNVIAEGVETDQQLDFLRTHKCDEMQGYLFSKPVPANEVPALLGCDGNAPGKMPLAQPAP